MTNALILIASICVGFVLGQLDWKRATRKLGHQDTSPGWVRIERQLHELQTMVDGIQRSITRVEMEQIRLRKEIEKLAKEVADLDARVHGQRSA